MYIILILYSYSNIFFKLQVGTLFLSEIFDAEVLDFGIY